RGVDCPGSVRETDRGGDARVQGDEAGDQGEGRGRAETKLRGRVSPAEEIARGKRFGEPGRGANPADSSRPSRRARAAAPSAERAEETEVGACRRPSLREHDLRLAHRPTT